IAPAALPTLVGVTYRSFVPNLPKLLAACDLAILQGGLSTCMELTASGTPFIHVPLQNHFEQLVHVPSRLRNYAAGLQMSFHDLTPDALEAAVSIELAKAITIIPVERDGATRAAAMLAKLLV
ncbi:glycosyltransferase, partial [Novosphingobium sp.]|uniref:glycosyltransferase n=1 Tax=Novosphingobium sp. TaxID=1874826 RepID=UPI00356775E8